MYLIAESGSTLGIGHENYKENNTVIKIYISHKIIFNAFNVHRQGRVELSLLLLLPLLYLV